jgi:small subunit ribosomal protein S18
MNDNDDNQIDGGSSDALGARRRRSGGGGGGGGGSDRGDRGDRNMGGGMGGGLNGPGGPGGRSKRSPAFSGEEAQSFDYKDPQQLKYFISDRGKITPRRVSGLSAKQQRALTLAVKRARNIALLPYTDSK